jgi:hypothetical protein
VTDHVFIGPTLSSEQVLTILPEAVIHPPVKHGDLLRLGVGGGDVVVIVDGVYHHAPSVRHKEIMALLAADVAVVGCASMGALRAAELHQLGMIGHGTVFDLYRTGSIDADDEVALAHSEGPEYRRLSEPLVNIRCALSAARHAGVITGDEAAQLLQYGRDLSYPNRSWPTIARLAAGKPSIGAALRRVRDFIEAEPRWADVKASDAADTLSRLREITSAPPDRPWAAAFGWRSRYLYRWLADAAGEPIDGMYVGHGAVVHYRKVYDPQFRARWRRFALRRIVESRGQVSTSDLAALESAAVDVAAAHGVTHKSLTAAQTAQWLDAEEAARPLSPESVRLVLIRSFRPFRGTYDLLQHEPDLVDDATKVAVAESYVVNAEVSGWRPGQDIDRIKNSMLRQHLAQTWGVRDDDRSLAAASRDRGFNSLSHTLDAVRPFFLRHHLGAAINRATSEGVGHDDSRLQ